MIEIGQKLPSFTLKVIEDGQILEKETNEFFEGQTVLLFGVPGAFTPACSNSHLPSFIDHYAKIKVKGIDRIVCIAVNDAFVLSAWATTTQASNKITFIADGGGVMTKAMGLDWDGTNHGMGIRSKRFSMLVQDGIVKSFHVETNPGECSITDAQTVLADL